MGGFVFCRSVVIIQFMEHCMTKALQPIEQKEVAMYGDTVTAVRLSDGHIYVSVRHM